MTRPVFIDLETRSAADLKAVGGWNYAQHPTTNLLTVSWSEEKDRYSVWLPTVDEDDPELLKPPRQELLDTHLPGVDVFYGEEPPPELKALTSRPWCAHNAWTFDQVVWERLMGPEWQPAAWEDSYPLALASGLPGGLNQIGLRLWGSGKYEEGNRIAKEATRVKDAALVDPVNVPVGALVQVARYNVQDVRLLAWLWEELDRSLVLTSEEREILALHRKINTRGIKVDAELLAALVRLSTDCRTHALERIAELTSGELSSLSDLRSRKKIFDWLARVGVDLGKKPSLRKELIQRYIEKNSRDEQDFPEEHGDDPEDEESPPERGLALGIKVLELRMSALRITDSKLEAAAQSMDAEGIVRGLFAYWAAHTGRWAGRRIQVHNLPKPREGVEVWKAVEVYEKHAGLPYVELEDTVREQKLLAPKATRFLSVDDYTSALIRLLFIPRGKTLAVADLANIEARVLAWLAGEDWLMKSFWAGTDPYMAMAQKIFGPVPSWPMEGVKSLAKHPYRAVGKVVELGAGFQLGITKFAVYAAAFGIDLAAVGTSAKECILSYRQLHPAIAGTQAGEYEGTPYFRNGFWHHLQDATLEAVRDKSVVPVGRITYEGDGKHLLLHLPSGRRIVYRNAKIAQVVPAYAKGSGKTVPGVQYFSPRFGWNTLYGGKNAENATQAVARDFMAHGLLRVEQAGMPVVIHVHDEGGAETEDLDAFMSQFTTLPPWAPEFPLDAEGGLLPRYSKSPPPGVKEVVYRNGKPRSL